MTLTFCSHVFMSHSSLLAPHFYQVFMAFHSEIITCCDSTATFWHWHFDCASSCHMVLQQYNAITQFQDGSRTSYGTFCLHGCTILTLKWYQELHMLWATWTCCHT